jgi:hypothetical protein
MGYDRRFSDEVGSEDTLGRAVWGLGAAVEWAPHEPMRILSRQMLERAVHRPLEHPRAMSYVALGISHYLAAFPGAHSLRERLASIANNLVDRLEAHRGAGWSWPADGLTYGNAVVPHGILRAGRILDDDRLQRAGLEMLTFLTDASFRGGYYDAIGNRGWWLRGHEPAVFDQQPIEAGYMTDACAYAWHITGDARWALAARRSAEWFYGANRLGACLFDVQTGACFDGFTERGVNLNQGAESAIACALALLAISELDAAGAPKPSRTLAGGDGASSRPPAVGEPARPAAHHSTVNVAARR